MYDSNGHTVDIFFSNSLALSVAQCLISAYIAHAIMCVYPLFYVLCMGLSCTLLDREEKLYATVLDRSLTLDLRLKESDPETLFHIINVV